METGEAEPTAAGTPARPAGAELATFHGLFEAQARRTPGATALVTSSERLSYEELDARANQLAWHLIARGAGPEQRVALFLDRSIEAVVAILAVLKAGAAYVPVDPSYPQERTHFMLRDCSPALVVTRSALAGRLPDLAVPVVECDSAALSGESSANPEVAVELLNLAYVIYTSGSTGQPKGVEIAHHAAADVMRGQRALLAPTAADRVLHFSSLSFDASVWEIWLALHHGAALVIPSEARRRWRLRNVLVESEATIALIVPSALAMVLPPGPKTLSRLMLGGETCPPATARAFGVGREFFNAYGPTEVTIIASVARIKAVPADAVRVPIGEAFGDSRLYVLDGNLDPVPAGTPGELFVGGRGVARGYLGQPALTAERFLPDPFAPEPGARMYRSGDIVFVNTSGQLEFVGRGDGQVKLRGFRIELGEVEAAMLSHPDVSAAAVLSELSADGDPMLVGYVTLTAGSLISGERLRDHLAERLPEHMVVRLVVVLEQMPINPSGKLDRRALRALGGRGESPGTEAASEDGADAEEQSYRVVRNAELQHGIWPLTRPLPHGWVATDTAGTRGACLERVAELWSDSCPLSVRQTRRGEQGSDSAATNSQA